MTRRSKQWYRNLQAVVPWRAMTDHERRWSVPPQPYRLLLVLAVWPMRTGSMAAPAVGAPGGGAIAIPAMRALTVVAHIGTRSGSGVKAGDKKVMAPSWVSRGLHSESGGGRGLTARMLSVLIKDYQFRICLSTTFYDFRKIFFQIETKTVNSEAGVRCGAGRAK